MTVTGTPPSDVSAADADNPLLRPSDLPYQLPRFEALTDAHYAPAFAHALAAHRRELAEIADNPEPPTFENTMVALERSGALLERVESVFSQVAAADTNPTVQQVEQEITPQLAAHQDSIYLDPRLFARVQQLYAQREQLELDAEQQFLLERYHTDFVRAGAQLSADEREQLSEINQQLASLRAEFMNRVRAEGNELAVPLADPEELAGLSPDAVAAAAEAARERDTSGYLLTLLLPTSQPALASLHDRKLRERLHTASTSRGGRGGAHDTRELVAKIVSLRARRAALLGYPHHAAYQIADRTAGSLAAVEEVLGKLTPAAVANAETEAAALQQVIAECGESFPLQPWDWAFYAERRREQQLEVDYGALRAYFPLEQVLQDGVFFAANRLYGLRFTERYDLPTYHPEVRVFEVFEEDGTPLGLFLADLYARPSKRGGAWQTTFVDQARLRGTQAVAVVSMNISRPPAGQTALLTVDEVKTLFHEFGHALHSLLSDVNYPRFSGTNVPRDFVEYPSQVNEVWMLWPEVVSNYARHYQTGEPLPAETAERLRQARQLDPGFGMTEYLAAALLDLAWHRLSPQAAAEVADVVQFEAEALAAAGVALPAAPPRYRTTYFAHSFATEGYSAGYYSYVWSEVLDADTVEWFTESGGLSRESGEWFRRQLLARGGSIDPMSAFRDFRGREPRIEPLLIRRGLR